MEFERRVSGRFVERVFSSIEAPVAQSLLKQGVDVRQPGREVPIEQFSQALSAHAQQRFPELSMGEAMRRVGQEIVNRAKVGANSTLEEVMGGLTSKFESIGAFLEPQVHAHGDRFVAHFGDVASLHTFFLGLIEGVTSSTRENTRVLWKPEGLSGARYEVLRLRSEHLARVEQPLRVER
jgi:uncharacterized protein (TIGR02265 family)